MEAVIHNGNDNGIESFNSEGLRGRFILAYMQLIRQQIITMLTSVNLTIVHTRETKSN